MSRENYEFYEKVAQKFGDYGNRVRFVSRYETENPEEVFKEKLLEYSGRGKIVLDVGCADGRFTLSIACYFKKVTAIDLSDGMLAAARRLQKEKEIKNVSFEKQDVYHTTYPNETFDVVYSRRGPSGFGEIFRLLKPGGYFIEITIGEQDCRELKEIFDRGQDFGDWNKESHLKRDIKRLKKANFRVIFAKDYSYTEYYPTCEELDLFLQGVPIFEDFDSKKDRELLEKYVIEFKKEKGIELRRHRVVTVSCKQVK